MRTLLKDVLLDCISDGIGHKECEKALLNNCSFICLFNVRICEIEIRFSLVYRF